MIDQLILRLLDRRGVWMTPVEILDASPDYPVGDYVIADLQVLKLNGLLASRRRGRSNLIEYGLVTWPNAEVPPLTLSYFLYTVSRIIRQIIDTMLVRGQKDAT